MSSWTGGRWGKELEQLGWGADGGGVESTEEEWCGTVVYILSIRF